MLNHTHHQIMGNKERKRAPYQKIHERASAVGAAAPELMVDQYLEQSPEHEEKQEVIFLGQGDASDNNPIEGDQSVSRVNQAIGDKIARKEVEQMVTENGFCVDVVESDLIVAFHKDRAGIDGNNIQILTTKEIRRNYNKEIII